MWLRFVEFMQEYGVFVVAVMAVLGAVCVSAYQVSAVNGKKSRYPGVCFLLVALLGFLMMSFNLKAVVFVVIGYLGRSIILLVNGYGVGSFIRPVLYFKRQNITNNKSEEDVLDLF